MLKLLLPIRLLLTLAIAGGGIMATRQAGAAGMLPPGVIDALHLIDSKKDELAAAFQ